MDDSTKTGRTKAGRAIGWLMSSLGLLVGLRSLLMLGQRSIPMAMESPERFRDLLGQGLFTAVFLIISIVALHNPRRAGIAFLVSMPFVAFSRAYAEAVLWVPDPHGAYPCWPTLARTLAFLFLFFLPFCAALLAIRHRITGVSLFVVSTLFAALMFRASPWSSVMLPSLAAWSALFLVFGAFWLGTSKRGWPPLVAPQPGAAPRSPAKKLVVIFLECLIVAVLDIAATFVLVAMQSSLWTGDCTGPGLFVRPLRPEHAVFTARLIRVAHRAKVSGRWAGNWAIGLVRESFWGLPAWAPRLVLLTDNRYWEGETFFVSGTRYPGILTHLLPIVSANKCGHHFSAPVASATIQLRLLRKPPAAGKLVIAGYAQSPKPPVPEPASLTAYRQRIVLAPISARSRRPERDPKEAYEWFFGQPPRYTALAGARIAVASSSGTSTVVTDQDGIYELVGLRPDTYTLRLLDVPAGQASDDRKLTKLDLMQMRLVHLDLYTDWDGTIEGTVRDAAGGAARVQMELLNADGTSVWPGISGFLSQNAKDGSFRFANLPVGGRYLLAISTFGPTDDSPYQRVYYPSAKRMEDARILEIGTPNHIRNVDCTVSHLTKRDLQVRVLWPNHQPVDSGSVHVAYAGTQYYEMPIKSPQFADVPRTGVVELHVYGDARIRVQAEAFVEDKETLLSFRYSDIVDLDTAKLPTGVDLIVSHSRLDQARSTPYPGPSPHYSPKLEVTDCDFKLVAYHRATICDCLLPVWPQFLPET